mmetsp:Transcript_26358/g.61312  ORF Transcript_26358/g.61312 Transcript_26358/m.61312 type:complete len:214 (-) Transcript_26358:491-1132(-)
MSRLSTKAFCLRSVSSVSSHLGNQRCQVVPHVSTEHTRTEEYVHSIGKCNVGEHDAKAPLLSQNLHLSAIARESNLVGVDCNPTTQSTNQSMVNIYFFSRLLHVRNDILHFVVTQALAGRRQHILLMGTSGVFLNERIISKSRLGVLFRFGCILAARLSGSHLSHLCFLSGQLDEIFAIVGKLRYLLTLQTVQKYLEHIEGAVCIQLESNGGQ